MKPLKLFLTIILTVVLFCVESNAFAEDNVYKRIGNQFDQMRKNVDENKFSKWLDLNGKGTRQFKAGDYEKAIKTFNKALKLAPRSSVTLTNIGAVYLKIGNRDEAAKFFDEAVDANPDYANAWNMRGVMYFRESDFDKAKENFRKAHELFPDNKTVLNNLATVYRQEDNRNVEDWRQLGTAYEKIQFKGSDKATECYNKALELAPDNAAAWNSLAGLYYGMENYDKAIECYSKALSLSPTDYVIRQNLAFAYLRAENYSKVAEFFNKSLELAPKKTNSHYGLGVAYHKLGDNENAEACLKKALELSPNTAKIWIALGDIYFDVKDYEKAIEHFLKASELDSDNEEAYTKLAESCEALGAVYKKSYEELAAKATTSEDKLKTSKLNLAAAECTKAAEKFRGKVLAIRFKKDSRKAGLIMFSHAFDFVFYEINFLEE